MKNQSEQNGSKRIIQKQDNLKAKRYVYKQGPAKGLFFFFFFFFLSKQRKSKLPLYFLSGVIF
jgi:hypothetical protein